MSGWIRLHRGWRDCDVFGDEPMTEREAWVWLIEKAAWRATHRRTGKGEMIPVARGQFHTADRTLADAWGWDRKRVVRFLSRLEKCGMCTLERGQSGSTITVCNYDKYQDVGADNGTSQRASSGPAEGQLGATQEEGKEIKEKGTAQKRGRTPDFEVPDWVPAEPWAAFCAMRKRKKAPVDSYIAERTFNKLAEIRDDGWDAAKVLDKATLNNWTTIYTPTPGRDDEMRANSPAKPADPAKWDELATYAEGRGDTATAATFRGYAERSRKPQSLGSAVANITRQFQ